MSYTLFTFRVIDLNQRFNNIITFNLNIMHQHLIENVLTQRWKLLKTVWSMGSLSLSLISASASSNHTLTICYPYIRPTTHVLK